MADYFDLNLAVDITTPTPTLIAGATFQAFLPTDLSFSTPLPVFEASSGVALSALVSSSTGVLPQFRVAGDPQEIILRSGTFQTRLTSVFGRKGDPGKSAYDQAVEGGFEGSQEQFMAFLAAVGRTIAYTTNESGELILHFQDGTTYNAGQVDGVGISNIRAVGTQLIVSLTNGTEINAGELPPGPALSTVGATPGQVLTFNGSAAVWAAAAAGIVGAPPTWPTSFPPSTHPHDVGDLRDSGTGLLAAILTFLRADTPALARAAIGAGTGDSNLVIGTGAGNAAAGNHGHPATAITFAPSGDITATTVQAAILQAAALGGSATLLGGLAVVVWNGEWAPRPSGALVVLWISTSDAAAPVPSAMATWDLIIRNPTAVGA